MEHCRPDYKPWEQRVTCCHCGNPLADNQLVKDAMNANTTAGWAKHQLYILYDMAKHRLLPTWYIDRVRKICNSIKII